MCWIINIASIFVLCMLFAGIVIPQILLIAFRRRLFDAPNERKIHKGAVPRLGGIAFKPVMFFSMALVLGVNLALGHQEMLCLFIQDARALSFGFCALMLLYLTGMADDLIGIRYRAKFVIEMPCSIMLIAGGFWIASLHGVCGLGDLPVWAGYPLTFLIVVFIINAINLIDGIDGLASGLSSIAMVFYGVCFYLYGEYLYAMLSFALLGVLIPFFYYNVFGDTRKHKKIFMGDTGSMTVGIVLCLLSFKLLMCTPDAAGTPSPFLLAFSPILIPCMDVVRVYFHRLRNGKSPFLPDMNHIHHKLLAIGMKQRSAMITIVSTSLLLSLINISLSVWVNVNILLLADVGVWTAVNIWLTRRIRAVREKEKQFHQSNP